MRGVGSARGELIVEHLGPELLVFDTQTNEAHRLDGYAAAEFQAGDDVSRREVLRRLALAGAAATGGAALVTTIVAPSPAQAQSTTCVPACSGKGFQCCTTGSAPHCENGSCTCCGDNCCAANTVCCASGACCSSLAQCCTNPPCCMGTEVCVNGTCQQPPPPSDRNVKTGFAPVGGAVVLTHLC
jgi:hypothetical protein